MKGSNDELTSSTFDPSKKDAGDGVQLTETLLEIVVLDESTVSGGFINVLLQGDFIDDGDINHVWKSGEGRFGRVETALAEGGVLR